MNFLRVSAFAGLSLLVATSSALAAPPPSLHCAPGSHGSAVMSANAGDFDALELTNEPGSRVGFYAVFSNPAETGSLEVSGGAPLLNFPHTSGFTSVEFNPPVFLMLLAVDGHVSVNVVCNPGSGIEDALAQTVGTEATSLAMVRQSSHEQLLKLVRQSGSNSYQFTMEASTVDIALFDRMTATERSRAQSLKDLFDHEYNAVYNAYLVAKMFGYSADNEFYEWYLNDIRSRYREALDLNSHFGYFPSVNSDSAALSAINSAVGASATVENTFRLLGYGPTGGFEGNAVLGQGDNWIVSASAVGAVSQGQIAGGSLNSLSGRGTLNIVANLAPGLGVGLGLGVGATSAKAGNLKDHSYQYAADVLVNYELSPLLSVTGGLGYELSTHNYTRAGATGSVASHRYTADVGLSGFTYLAGFKMTPSLDVQFSHESQAAVTLTDGTSVNGFERSGGKATIGAQFSQVHFILTGTSAYSVEPILGVDTSLSLSHLTPTGGASSASLGLSGGVTAGVNVGFAGGLDLSLLTRLSRAGETTGASVTGKVSASF